MDIIYPAAEVISKAVRHHDFDPDEGQRICDATQKLAQLSVGKLREDRKVLELFNKGIKKEQLIKSKSDGELADGRDTLDQQSEFHLFAKQ